MGTPNVEPNQAEAVGKRKTYDLQVVCKAGGGGGGLVGLDLEPVGPALTPVRVRTELGGYPAGARDLIGVQKNQHSWCQK